MSYWVQWGFQDASSPLMEEFIHFNDFAMTIVSFILLMTLSTLWSLCSNKLVSSELVEGQLIESLWTMIPALVLIQIAIPSLMLLYMLDEALMSLVSIKVVAHQWYWSYEYSDEWSLGLTSELDSYMITDLEESDSVVRLLDADNRLSLPYGSRVSAMITSADVLHSWAVPVLGVKVDAVPGRLNQAIFTGFRPGVFYGQCSEICGANHSFMPIVIEFISLGDFLFL